MNYFKILKAFVCGFCLVACSSNSEEIPDQTVSETNKFEIKAADFSFLPEIKQSGLTFYNQNGVAEDMLTTFKNAGGNTVRLRIWVNPEKPNSDFSSVKALSQEIKSKGLKVWLSVHYSDSWADPAHQTKPLAWKNHSFSELKNDVYSYTRQIMTEIDPDYIQIGNEINGGFLWPEGSYDNFAQFKSLLQSGVSAVREVDKNSKIIIHFAGYQYASDFYSKLSDLDYDYIGLSYYPMWHGKNLDDLEQNLQNMSSKFNKKIVIAETAYPFTLAWNDNTNNIVGMDSQLASGFPATVNGQFDFMKKIKNIISKVPNGIGFCYWGTEWTSYKGKLSTDGSTWENQAFWNFDNKALPVLDVYKD